MKSKSFSSIISLMLALVLALSGIMPYMQVSAAESSAANYDSWKIQDWGGATDIEVQDGWIEARENGFVLNYDKIIADREKEGLVLYDSQAEQYANSVLEMDLTVSEAGDAGQVGFYSVALLSRFLNGANCEGIAVHDKGRLQRAGYKEGNETWEWVRNDKNDFLFGETYHLKVVTEGETLTLSAAKKGEELQELVSLTMKTGLEASGYGFRIWRGAKKIAIENIVRTELKTDTEEGSCLNETEASVPDGEWGQATIQIPVTFAEGDSVQSISDGEIDLTEGSHYSVDMDNSIITISPDYMKGQTIKDEITLTVSFVSGAQGTFKIVREASENSGWVFQKQNSSETVTPQDGWITVSENGTKAVIHYGKVVEDAGEGWVIFDGSAPQYKNSNLEYDLTFTDPTQGDWIAVAPVTRVTDGRNYEGFAFTSGTGLERQSRRDGSESYAGISNLLGIKFEYNKTYHLRMETIENVITVYLTRDGVEEKLTSFESQAGLDKGSYGFRIWRGSKTITLENIKRTEIVTSSLERSTEVLSKDAWGKTGVSIPVQFGSEDEISSIMNGDETLNPGTDYTVEDSVFTLKQEYIAAQEGTFRLQVKFAKGSACSLWIVQRDSVAKEYTWTPDQGVDMWESVDGSGSFELAEDGKAMHVTGTNALINKLTPIAIDGEIEITFEALRDLDGYDMGALFRADDVAGNWQAVASTDSINGEGVWDFVTPGGKSRIVWDGVQNMSRDGVIDIKVKVRFVEDSITFWIDDQFANVCTKSQAESVMGNMGLYVDNNGEILVKKVVFRELFPFEEAERQRETVSIANDGLTVRLDKDFPRVVDYTLNQKVMKGAKLSYDYVTINTVDMAAEASIIAQDDRSVTYHVTPDAAKTGVTFDVKFTVLEDQILEMLILNVHEPEDELVYSIGLPKQPLISADSTQADAMLDASYVNKNNRHFANLHKSIANKEISANDPVSVMIPVITADGLSASMYNNVMIGGDEFVYQAFTLADGEVTVGVWNTDFMYRGVDGEKILPFPSEPDETELYCRIAVTEDTNEDGILNWQDGANALKKLTTGIIPGSDQAQRSFFHVGYNFASGAQQPFLQVADNMKRLSNYIDGFSQQLVFKGYASEGHDSGHADYEDINKRAGGAEAMNVAIAEADKIHSNFGIHINSQEIYPEAKMFNEHVAGDRDGWRWMDQSKILRRYVDMLEGGFEDRLDKLYEQTPDLDFVYVDCWGEDRWGEKKLIGTLLENGAELFGNENAADFIRFGVWTHSTSGNNNSPMNQFVYNSQRDVYPGNGIYWGGYGRSASMMSWQHRNDINGLVSQFYTNQLPQKYLMCHEVRRVDGNTGYFDGNVTSGNYVITKDGNKITDGQGKIFIPWYDEDSETKNPDEAAKIYHWNNDGGNTTWTLPDSWTNVTSVYLYQTTQNGKKLVGVIPVEEHQVTINASANTPYVVYPAETKEDTTEWSVGSPLKDTGFNSRDFSIWQKSGDADIAFHDDGNGVSILTISGTEAGAVSQTMTGLVPGQKYRVLAYAGAENGKTARITVNTPDGKTHENYLEQVIMQNNYFDNYAKNKMVQLMWVDFTQPEGKTTAEVILSGDACEKENGKSTFMQTRIVKTAEPDLPKGYVANETFEYIEQGAYGIFNPERAADGVPHLSETHLPYTTDTISGDWSLKMYGHYGQGNVNVRTSPATMRLKPNTEYSMEFDTLGGGSVYVVSEADGSDQCLESSFSKGHGSFTFTTGEKTDYIVRIVNGSVLDNFQVYTEQAEDDITDAKQAAEAAKAAQAAAEAAQAAAEEAQAKAETAKTDAEAAAREAEAAQAKAEAAQAAAEEAAAQADADKAVVEQAKKEAEAAKEAAETAKQNAKESADQAETAREAAETAQRKAETAKNAAETAKEAAEAARDGAVEAKNQAEAARDAAENARDEAQSACDSASTAQAAAESAKESVIAQAGLAEAAKNAAEAAQALAEAAQRAAEKARDEAAEILKKAQEEFAKAEDARKKAQSEADDKLARAEAMLKEAMELEKQTKDYVQEATFKAQRVTITSAKSKKKKTAKITWKKVDGAEGYVIEYALKANFKGAKAVTIRKGTTGSRMLKKLKSRKAYYVRVKAYKTVNGKKIFTDIGAKKKVRVK